MCQLSSRGASREVYKIGRIEQLAQAYVKVKTRKNSIFKNLMQALIPLINTQLRKNYQSIEEHWDDLRQETLLKLYKNRKSLLTTTSTRLFLCLYNRIRGYLRTTRKNIKSNGIVA